MRLSELVICHEAGRINSHQDMLLKQSPMDSGHRYFLPVEEAYGRQTLTFWPLSFELLPYLPTLDLRQCGNRCQPGPKTLTAITMIGYFL